jgi:predicted transcriptional regulator
MSKKIVVKNIEDFGVLEAIELLIKHGLIKSEKGKAFLTPKGALVSLKVEEAMAIFNSTDDQSIIDLAVMSELEALYC